MNRYLKLFGVTIVAVVLIASAAYAIMSFLTSESNISISLRIKDIEGNIVEKGVVYAWALMPNNASVLIGAFEIKNGVVKADIREPMQEVIMEWKKYFGENSIVEPLQPSIWMTISFPGGIYSGITALYSPSVLEKYGGTIAREITIPTSVDYSKPVPELLKSRSAYYEGESWVPVLVVVDNGHAYVRADFLLGSLEGAYYYSRTSWILTREVENIDDINSLLDSDVTYHIGEDVMGHSGAVYVGSRVLVGMENSSRCFAVLVKVKWAYEEYIYKIEYDTGTKYIGEARVYIKEFLRDDSGDLAVNVLHDYDYSWIKSYGRTVTYKEYEGKGVVNINNPTWQNDLETYGEGGSVPKVTEEDILSMDSSKGMLYLPLGHEISKELELKGLETALCKDAISRALVAIDYGTGSPFLKVKCYSDAPKGMEYEVKYVVLDHSYKYYDSNLGEREGSFPIMIYVEYSDKI